MSRDPPSGLGDLARALAQLRPEDEATRLAIAELLLGISADARPVEPVRSLPSPALQPLTRFPDRPPAQEEPLQLQEEAERWPIPFIIKSLARTTPGAPAWFSSAATLPAEPPPGAVAEAPLSLMKPLQSRAILGSLAAAPGEGPLDVEALLQSVARGQALAQLPHHPIPTLARGVQLLVDRGDAMLPFHLDAEGLERELTALAGSGVEVLHFVACPSRGCGRGMRRRWKPYGLERMPRLGARILCVTDLGLGLPPPGDSAASVEEWVEFAGTLRRAGYPVGALVPYPPNRWPSSLSKVMDLYHWDRSLTVARAARGVFRRG
ncbi:hypothetical protein D7X96_24135 [Corallococcus interemptor]|uniref:Uncharacterized protein n=1 Tax=Corallococcus interemptor TaxID=2316720 RepID=A0A3A8QE09_9BACT|nr:hypothetical protein [Corallococcus interemptor]RKH65210.1 hypothetical protein D7X96_24135 [Corallococcus interemptor]